MVEHIQPVKKRKLSPQSQSDIHTAAAEFIASNLLPTTFFEKAPTKKFFAAMTSSLNKAANPDDYCPSKYYINETLAEKEKEIKELLKKNATTLVKKSSLFVIMDDWTHTKGSFEHENEYRAVLFKLTDRAGESENYMASFHIATGKRHEDIMNDVTESMDDYGLKTPFEQGLIPVACDNAMVGAANKMTGGHSATTCMAHSLTRISKRLFIEKAELVPNEFKEKFEAMVENFKSLILLFVKFQICNPIFL